MVSRWGGRDGISAHLLDRLVLRLPLVAAPRGYLASHLVWQMYGSRLPDQLGDCRCRLLGRYESSATCPLVARVGIAIIVPRDHGGNGLV